MWVLKRLSGFTLRLRGILEGADDQDFGTLWLLDRFIWASQAGKSRRNGELVFCAV